MEFLRGQGQDIEKIYTSKYMNSHVVGLQFIEMH